MDLAPHLVQSLIVESSGSVRSCLSNRPPNLLIVTSYLQGRMNPEKNDAILAGRE